MLTSQIKSVSINALCLGKSMASETPWISWNFMAGLMQDFVDVSSTRGRIRDQIPIPSASNFFL